MDPNNYPVIALLLIGFALGMIAVGALMRCIMLERSLRDCTHLRKADECLTEHYMIRARSAEAVIDERKSEEIADAMRKLWLELRLEEKMQVSHDTKKAYDYDKSSGLWAWGDKDEYDPDNWHAGFDTFIDALNDAVEPYFNEDSDE